MGDRSETRAFPSLPTTVAFLVPLVVAMAVALRGGSYDIVAREELGLALWWLLGLGVALGLLPAVRPSRAAIAPAVALLALAGWTALGLLWTHSAERTFAEVARGITYAGLVLWIVLVVDRRTWRAAAGGLATAALAISALAALSRLAPSLFPADGVGAGVGAGRLNYPFDYWNAVGAWSAIAAVLGLGWSVYAHAWWLRAAALAAVPATVLAGYLTYSRGAIAAATVGVVVVLVLGPARLLAGVHLAVAAIAGAVVVIVVRHDGGIAEGVTTTTGTTTLVVLVLLSAVCGVTAAATWRLRGDRWRMPRRPAVALSGALAGALVVAGAVAGPGLASRAWDSFRQATVTGSGPERLGTLHGTRYEAWDVALQTFSLHPWRGIGGGTFEFAWNHAGRSPEFLRDAHSLYIESLAELGWPGLVLVLAVLMTLAVAAIRGLRSVGAPADRGAVAVLIAAGATLAVNAAVDWIWESTAVWALGMGCLAIAGAAAGSPRRGGGMRLTGRLAIVAVAVVACLVMLPGLVATTRLRESQSAFASGNLAEADRRANQALDAEPWAAGARTQRALVEEAQGRLVAARRDLVDAAGREPTNWRPPLLLARVEAEMGHAAAALAAYRIAQGLRPASPLFRNSR